MENSEHILSWCENSQPHWRKLCDLVPGNFISATGRAYAAVNLAVTVANAMVKAGDMRRKDLHEADILQAALLFLEWRKQS